MRNPHVAFDAAGTGNVARSRYCDTRQPKGASNGNTNFDSNPARQSSTLLGRHLTRKRKDGTLVSVALGL